MIAIPQELVDQIKADEGYKDKAYWDPIGKVWTCGYGQTGSYITEKTTCTESEATVWLTSSIEDAALEVNKYIPWAVKMGIVRWSVFVNMAYNEGINNLLEFNETLDSAEDGNYSEAAADMMESEWAVEVQTRAVQLSKQMETGVWQL